MFLGMKRRVQTGGREDGELSSHSAAPHQRLTQNFTSQCPLVERHVYSLSQKSCLWPVARISAERKVEGVGESGLVFSQCLKLSLVLDWDLGARFVPKLWGSVFERCGMQLDLFVCVFIKTRN